MLQNEHQRRRAGIVVLAAAAVYAVYFGLFTCIVHERFATSAYDLGTFDQGIWLAGHGRGLFVTVRGLPLLGDHVRLFSFVLAPLYWLWDDVRALLLLQSAAIAAGALFLWRIAIRELPSRPWIAATPAVAYLLHPAVQNLNLEQAHPDAFATTLILASIDFLRSGRRVGFAVAAALAMSCKEDVPLVFVAMGLAMMLDRRRRGFGFVLAGTAAAYFAFCLGVILPWANGEGFFRAGSDALFEGLGRHGGDPLWILGRLGSADGLRYLASLGAANLYLFVASPLAVVPALPALAANLLADAPYPRSLGYHYQTSILPFLYLGTIDTLAFAAAWLQGRRGEAARDRTASAGDRVLAGGAVLLMVATVAANLAWSNLSIARAGELATAWHALRTDPRYARIEADLATIPAGAVVAAEHSLVPHLSHRARIYMFPNPFRTLAWGIRGEGVHDPEGIEYIVVRDKPGSESSVDLAEALVASGRFEPLLRDSDVRIYRRVARTPPAAASSCGDWNGDGRIDGDDLGRIADAVATGRECPARVCDTDGDGIVRNRDVLLLARRVRDPAVELKCGR